MKKKLIPAGVCGALARFCAMSCFLFYLTLLP